MIRVIGDIHGKLDLLGNAIKKSPKTDKVIQLGDLGFTREWKYAKKTYNPKEVFIIPGNHDDYSICDEYEGCLHGFGFVPETDEKVAFISGAFSIDYMTRHIGIDLWENEELSYQELSDVIEWWENKCQNVTHIITHTAPQHWCIWYYTMMNRKVLLASRTENALDSILDLSIERKQKLTWIHGHHHLSVLCESRFAPVTIVSLDEGETFDFSHQTTEV